MITSFGYGRSGLSGAKSGRAIAAEAIAFRDALAAQGYTLTSSRLSAYSAFISSAKSAGYWNKLNDAGTFEGSTIAQASVKLKGTGTLTASGMVDADLLPNGGTKASSTGRFTTNVLYNTIPVATNGFCVWVSGTVSTAADRFWIGRDNATTPLNNIYYGSSPNAVQSYSQSVLAANLGGPPVMGLLHTERTGSNVVKFYANGRQASATATGTATSPQSSVATVWVTSGVHFYALTNGTITDAEALQMAADIRRLLIALERITISSSPLRKTFVVGQSLATGTNSTPVLSTTQPYSNRRPLGQRNASAAVDTIDAQKLLQPAIERTQETPASGFQNQVSKLYRDTVPGSAEHDTLITNWGAGGTAYSGLKKGTLPYLNSLDAVSQALNVAPLTHTGVNVPGIVCVHGESDQGSATYQADVTTWQSDYEADIKSITGQAGTIPMFHSQPSSWTSTGNVGTATVANNTAIALLAAHKANSTKTPLVCPKYFLTHAADGLHLTNTSSRWLGEYYGKAWHKQIVQGQQWHPLYPSSIVRSGATITVSFNGRVGNLVLDTTSVSNPGNFGFEWSQTGGTAQTISSVALSGDSTQVIITLSGDPGTPTTQRLRYAYTGTAGANGGPTTGPRGNLRDSDPTVSQAGNANLYNWCCHFDEAVS